MNEDLNQDRRYLSTPNLWVTWPLVPVKTIDRGLNREIGVIIEESRTIGWQVYMTNMFSFDPKAPVKVYATLDDLLDVWMVD